MLHRTLNDNHGYLDYVTKVRLDGENNHVIDMKTKVVYVLTSSLADTYLEQMWISIYSLRQVQPDAYIQVVMDCQTADSLVGTRANWKVMIDETTIVDCPPEYDALYRSRYIKTRLRHFVKGDFLYVDTDTVFGAAIANIDNTEGSVCGVLDYLQSKLRKGTDGYKRAELLGFAENIEEKAYINGGVLYVKEDVNARKFYDAWHKYWLESVEKGLHYDQFAFNMAKSETGDLVQQLPDIWNYQIKGMLLGTEYKDAIIYHYFSSVSPTILPTTIVEHPITYNYIRELGDIPSYLQEELKKTKAMFQNRITVLDLYQQQSILIVHFLKFHPFLRSLLYKIVSFFVRVK